MSNKKSESSKTTETTALAGILANHLSVVETSTLQLLTTFAQRPTDEDEIIAPLVVWSVRGKGIATPAEPLSFETIITADNAAFLISDFAAEFEKLLERLDRIGVPAAVNVERVSAWLSAASQAAARAAEIAERLKK